MLFRLNDIERGILRYLANSYSYNGVTYKELISIIRESPATRNTPFERILFALSLALYKQYGKPLSRHEEERRGFMLYKDKSVMSDKEIVESLQDERQLPPPNPKIYS